MTTATAAPAARKREPTAVALATVTYDRDRSTPFHEVYHAQSDTSDHTYKVVHDVQAGRWDCEEDHCLGFRHRRICRHIRRAQRLRRVQWWRARFLGYGPRDLLGLREVYRARDAELGLTEEERTALDVIGLLLDEAAGLVAA